MHHVCKFAVAICTSGILNNKKLKCLTFLRHSSDCVKYRQVTNEKKISLALLGCGDILHA